MMDVDRHSMALVVGFATFLTITGVVPSITAERPLTLQYGVRTAPLKSADLAQIDRILSTPGVASIAQNQFIDSLSLARVVATAHGEDEALSRARDALFHGDYRRAEALCSTLVEQVDAEAQRVPVGDKAALERLSRVRNQALLLKSNVLRESGDHEAATKALSAVSPKTPVNDHVLFLLGDSFHEIGEMDKAAEFFGQVAAIDETPLKHRATARRAHALFDAGEWKKASKALDTVIATYPLYPRRYLALWERAVALDKLEKGPQAAQAYWDTWWEFPYKKVGASSRKRVEELAKLGVRPAKLPTNKDKYERYRLLRINKHWDLARRLFTELKAANATPGGHSAFEHDIEFQLGLNDYGQRKYHEARRRLEGLRTAYDAGHRQGISRYLLFKYLAATYRRLKLPDQAHEALGRMSEGYGANSAQRAMAEYYEEVGESAKALKIYDELYSKYKKRGWHYTWLLYKSGKFEGAYENLKRLAERSSGRRRVKYMYWMGRTLERAGKHDEARQVFQEIADTYNFDYYAIQARNRMMDIDQRTSVSGQLAASAESIANSADEVLDALEEAGDKASAESFVESDPRSAQRHALWGQEGERAEWTGGKKCDPSTAKGRKYCKSSKINQDPKGKKLAAKSEDESKVVDDDPEPEMGVGEVSKKEMAVPTAKLHFEEKVPRIEYSTAARIYWDGRASSGLAFARMRQGEVVGPMPKDLTSYDETSHIGGLNRAVQKYGELFPTLLRAQWMHVAGYEPQARAAARHAAIEFRELRKRYRPRRKPHEIKIKRWDYLIDNRRGERSGFWGLDSEELRYPVPESKKAIKKYMARQQKIHDMRDELTIAFTDALKEVGDFYIVRKLTLAKKGWYRADPSTVGRKDWMQAYPRAFPRQMVAHAERNGVNPYLLWALMTVESSYNPDSLSTANALGLLQVIPRTGLKTAIMLGDEEFGPHDLLDADTAIEHGAFYFSRLVRKFRGQELFAIVGYNGGPHRVGDWIEDRGHTMPIDEFVEEVPFNQARMYVKKVLRFLAIYLTLYESRQEVYVGQNIRTDYRPDPNF